MTTVRATAFEAEVTPPSRALVRLAMGIDRLSSGRRRRVIGLAVRVVLLAAGAFTVATSVAVMLWNDLGPGPLDVLISALRTRTGLPLMLAIWITVGTLTLIAWALGRRPGLGTVLGPFVVGPSMQWVLHGLEHFDPPNLLPARIAIQLAAVTVLGLGAGAAIASGLGPGTGELLASAASDHSGRPEPRMRLVLESTWLLAGVLLGGPIGLGTVLVAFFIGPSVARGSRLVHGGIAASRRQLGAALPR